MFWSEHVIAISPARRHKADDGADIATPVKWMTEM